jgi:hypothetical protein
MIEKARRVAAFLSWYSQTSLPKDMFALTYMFGLHVFVVVFVFVFVVFFSYSSFFIKNKMGGERCIILFPYLAFQISYVFLPYVLVLGALILLAFI